MFEANCSRQMGQHKKKRFHQMFFVFTRGVTKMSSIDTCQSGFPFRLSLSYQTERQRASEREREKERQTDRGVLGGGGLRT